MAPAQLCSQERFRVHDHSELKQWDLLVEYQSHQKAFLLGRWAEAGARGGLPRRHSACRGCWLYCTSPRSTLSCLSPSFHYYKTRKLLQVHKVQLNRVAHPSQSNQDTHQDYFAGGNCEFRNRWMSLMFHVRLQQVSLTKLLQKRKA